MKLKFDNAPGTRATSVTVTREDGDKTLYTEEDFVKPTSGPDAILQLKLEIVKHVIAARVAEAEAAKTAADRKAKKERLLEIIARKQDDALQNTSLEDLQKMVEAL